MAIAATQHVIEHAAGEVVITIEAIDAIANIVIATQNVIAGGGTTDHDPLQQLLVAPLRAIGKADLFNSIAWGCQVLKHCKAIATAECQLQIVAMPKHPTQIIGVKVKQLNHIEVSHICIAVAELVMAITAAEQKQIITSAARDQIIAFAAEVNVTTRATDQLIVAIQTQQEVIAGGIRNQV